VNFSDVKQPNLVTQQLLNAILKYTPSSSFTIKIAHMEKEEIFGSYKQKLDLVLVLGSKGDSHKHDH
jgi:hypothetical protein